MKMAKLPPKDKVLKWSNEDLLRWLRKVDLHDCLQAFEIRAINGAKLLDLSDDLVITFSELKINRRRQIVKCINECKTQAGNAKKLVGNIKDHSKNKGVDQSDDDDDDCGWDTDFDDDEESDTEKNEDKDERLKTSYKYDIKQKEDQLYEPVSDYMSNGIQTTQFKLLEEENQLHFKAINVNVAQEKCETSQHFNKNENQNGINNEKSQIDSKEIEIFDKMQTCSSIDVKGVSPKPSPRVMPKPPSTKPEVPKNKPQIFPRKPFTSNGSKTLQSSQIKRPPSEPPPPPLPKSPPPASPLVTPLDLQSIFSENCNISSNSRNADQEVYESIILPLVPDDEYLSPIRPETPIIMDRKHSSSTISSQSFSTRDGDSPVGAFPPLSPQTSSKTSLSNNSAEEDYEPFFEKVNCNEISKMNDSNEGNYEIVDDNEAMNCNASNNVLPIGPRPLLPKARETTPLSSTKNKLIPDVFPNLPNWRQRNVKDKTIIKDKQESDPINEENANSFPNSDLFNINNSNSTNNSIGTRPLPPLPQMHALTGNESLRNFEWFHTVEREDAEALLMTQDQDGAYLVRESKRAGKSNPYTLTIFHDGRVFHLNIRKRTDGLYALGKDKPREKTFKTVADLVAYHTTEPILLTTRGTPAGKTRLIITPTS